MRPSKLNNLASAIALSVASLAGLGNAHAAIVGNMNDVDFMGGSTTFSYLGQSFTLSDNRSGFPSPVSASTSGTAMLATDFFGISVFFDPVRGPVFFDGSSRYASYASATAIAYSATPSFIGLALTALDGVHYGYAEFSGTLLEGYAFQSAPGVGIAAGAALVPEPESVALLGLGFAALMLARKRRR